MQKMMKQLGVMGGNKKQKGKKGRGLPHQRGGMLPSGLSDLFGGR
jgi:hypothetical protein